MIKALKKLIKQTKLDSSFDADRQLTLSMTGAGNRLQHQIEREYILVDQVGHLYIIIKKGK